MTDTDLLNDYYDKLCFIYPSWSSELILQISEYCCAHQQHNTSTDELKALAQYHLEKFKNWMRPLMDPDAISSEITIQMPPVKLPASKK